MFQWRNIIKGFMMGISDLIPGVSGGTIALVLGIYQDLIGAINGLFTKDWKRHLLFLLPLGLGIGLALLSVSRLIEWLLAEFPQPTFFFFLGLIIGIIPALLKEIDFKRTFVLRHYILLGIGAMIVASTLFIKDNEVAVIGGLSLVDYLFLFMAGWLASSAMILPGISGSFIFLLLGVYPTVINALSTLYLPVLITVGIGVAFGLVLTSKLISYLLVQFKTGTYAVMIGFIIGSIVVIFPGITGNNLLILISAFAFVAGGLSAYVLSYLEVKKTVAKLNVQ
ncbi:DUF368 domain-containing protein [Halalkalibacter akibai]|uniref:DUF368 domain-containing protein n=1 Tax=Halalkalibacter akibai (strain ATCC 43226 / DSM 21942 / CIP 109018 / JCM 9157 / 1139) TaxID=1236973 RepID=W4QZQ9_HALA3|nr:DUF368 domain-containing protein [Halalkalibacter akibai]GAE37153.1 hypothetical protein JCM9157_4410 [Halalkalibacter akibai JCM 9157]